MPIETEFSILQKYCGFMRSGRCDAKGMATVNKLCMARGCPLQARLRKFRRLRSKRLGARARTKARGKY